MAMTWSDWVTALGDLLEYPITSAASASPSSDTNFNNILPRAVEFGELKIQRDFDLVATTVTDTGAFTPNSRTLTLPTSKGTFQVVEQIAVLISGVRQPPMLPASREFIEAAWPAEAAVGTSVPQYWCLLDNLTALVGPSPNLAYGAEVAGTQRFTPLSAANPSTFISQWMPDLFLAATMIFMCGYQRDFGAASDDPKMALSWQATYDGMKSPAMVEELRKSFASAGWSARQPNPIATPPQT